MCVQDADGSRLQSLPEPEPHCRRFSKSWSWHPNLFQTISSGQQSSLCLFISMSSLCGCHGRRVSSFTPRFTVRQCFISKLYGDVFFGEGEGENCCLCLHFTDLKTPVVCPQLYLIHSFLDFVGRRCGVFRCTPHSEIICMYLTVSSQP